MFKNNIYTISGVAAILIAISAWYIYQNSGRADGDPYNMIPNDAALIIEIDNPNNVFDELSNNNNVWKGLLKVHDIEMFSKRVQWIDTLLADNTDYLSLLQNSTATFVFFADTTGICQTLILSKIEHRLNIEEVKRMLSRKLGRKFALLDIERMPNSFKVVDLNSGVSSYFTYLDGVFIYSSSFNLLAKTHETYSGISPKLTDNHIFMELAKTSGAKVAGRIFIQYRQLVKLIKPIVNLKNIDALNWIANNSMWTGVDLMIKKKEFIFSGYSKADVNNSPLSELSGQQLVKLNAINVAPFDANIFIWLGLSNFKEYYYKRNSDKAAKKLSVKLNADITKLINVIGNEVAFVSSAETQSAFSHNSWLIVSTKNKTAATSMLKRISRNTGSTTMVNHGDYVIRKINDKSFVSDVFGSAFSVITHNYYTFVGDYIVFANSQSSIINLINYFETGKTLDLNDNFKSFSNNISSQSNFLVYIKPRQLKGRISEYLSDDVVKQVILNSNVINSFQGVALQLSTAKPLYYTNLYFKYSNAYHEENLATWKVQLDTEVAAGPYLVKDFSTKKKDIIVFDKLSNMYFIDPDGKVQWKKKLDAVPVSNVFEVDVYKNNKIQYLFNTGSYIYIVDKKGRDVTGFPKKLHSKATNGIVVFDYLNNKNYRMLIAEADKQVYNYTIKGNEVRGWKPPHMQDIVVEPVTRLLANRKDYIIITDIANGISIVDRKGNRRIRLKGKLNKAKHSDYYLNHTNSKGIIITTNEEGKLVYISASGRLKYTDFGNFSKNHFFLYDDFNGDKSKDFIFVDGNSLKVFDRFKKELFSYKFESEIKVAPSFFSLGKNEHVLGVVADDEKTIYLFDKSGNIIISKGLVGETPFTVGDLEHNNKINLISASGNMLYNYRLK